ncbi:MAG: MFS transporter [Nitrospinaceae bacterium]
MTTAGSWDYWRILKSNRDFRNLWYGQVISELGDWLNSIAISMLVLQLGGGGLALAITMAAKLLPIFFVSPIAGVLTDRMDRRTILIVSDLLRFPVVLCFLWVDQPGELWLLYTLVVLEIALAGFFEPARSALIPSLTRREDLVTANALSGSTWSVMVALGAVLGGVVVSLFGLRTAFVVDAFTFLASAACILRIPRAGAPQPDPKQKEKSILRDLTEAGQYLKREPGILALALLKSGLAISGGIMTLIPLYAKSLYSASAAVSMGIGVLYSCRGVGAALGPPLVRRVFGDSSRVLRGSIAAAFFLGAAGHGIFALAETLIPAGLGIGLATFFGSIIWVFSSALIHLEAEDRFLGRIFSLEMALLTLVMGISNFAVGWAVDVWGFTPQQSAMGISFLFLAPGLGWWVFLSRQQSRAEVAVASVCPVEPSDAQVPPTSL